jgi:hypothetical protein
MPNYNPEPLEFAVKDFQPHQYNFGVAKSDGIYMGRMLMKNEVLSLIKAAYPVPTKAIARSSRSWTTLKSMLTLSTTSHRGSHEPDTLRRGLLRRYPLPARQHP